MRGVRGWGRWLAAPVVVAAGLGAGTAPGAAQAAEPAVTLTPATGLVDGDTVTISATGLAPASSFAVLQCAADPAGGDYYDSCDTDDTRFLSADPGGALTTTLRVDVHLALSGGGPAVDCRPAGACVIRLAGAPGDLSAPLAFDPDAPAAPAPTLTVDPATDLVDGQTVTVQAAGLVWTQSAVVIECAAGSTSSAGCDFDTIEYVDVGADGTAAASVRVNALLATADGTVDCRLPGACVLAVTPDYGRTPERIGTAPLAFDPDGQVQLATLGATPDTDLVDGQTVTAAGTGYTDGFLSLFQCGDDGAGERCEYLDFAAAAPDGTFSAPVKVRAVLDLDGTGDLFDCRTSAQPCVLVATTTSPESARAGRAPLHFRPDGPLEPGPALTVSPGGPLGDEASITVTGTRFTPDGYASVQVCRIDDGSACDPQAYSQVTPDHAGTFTVDLGVAATFTDWRGQSVDCRAAPGCQVTGIDGPRNRRGSAPLSFAPASTEIERYLDPVFADVDITADVPYRTATTAAGQSVGLTLDVYQPTGDTETTRPAIVWLPGGWFRPLGAQEMSPQIATAFARRGYVVIVPDYRQRPALQCCPTGDVTGVTNALLDAHADGRAAVAWVRSHAADYGIDDRAIVAGGSDAGAATALDLAHLPGQMGVSGSPPVAAAVAVAGVDLGRPDPGEPPVIAFHDAEDRTAPLHLSEWGCARARSLGTRCDTVGYQGVYTGIAQARQRDVVSRSAQLLADTVLAPLGYDVPTVGPATLPVTAG
ncbi:MAG TPA: neocarzinostatin apoprotein domain-containing protein, partial [Acidimicrobiales bacterium]